VFYQATSIKRLPLAVQLFDPRLEFLEAVPISAVLRTGLGAAPRTLAEHRDRADA
jgi:hypothetical protein